MNILFLSCLRATEMIEKRLHFKLSFTEGMQLKFHKMMCDACRRYENQNLFLEKSMMNKKESTVTDKDVVDLKKLIIQKLDK